MTAIATIYCAGCQQAEIIFHRHQPLTAAETQAHSPRVERETAVLASHQELEQPQAADVSPQQVPPRTMNLISAADGLMAGPAVQAPEAPPPAQPTAPTATQPSATQPGYTAPSVSIRYATLGVGLASAAIGVPDTVGGGREAAEAQVLSSTALLTGAPGLAAPSPTVQGTATSAPGIQRGPAASLGPASPNNLFNRQLNPASGPNGVNAELRRAGFPTGSIPGGQRSRHR